MPQINKNSFLVIYGFCESRIWTVNSGGGFSFFHDVSSLYWEGLMTKVTQQWGSGII